MNTPAASARRTVLIIEDSRAQAMRLRGLLEAEALQVVLARTGREGLDLAGLLRPDAIILDVGLPDINGFNVCLILQAQPATAKIPVIMLTQLDSNLAALRSLESGAVEFIPKDDFADAVLLESLRQMGLLTRHHPPVQP